MLNVKITIDDGSGKKAEIEISEADNLSKMLIIDNVFKLFGIDTDILSMVEDYNKIGKMYSSFFNQVESIEADALEKIDKNKNEIKDKLTQAYEDNKEEIETTYLERNDAPEFVRSGIKEDKDGTKRYRLHYKCIACWNRGSHFIFSDSKKTWCHKCQHELTVYPAHPSGFPYVDNFNNFFRAGEFYDWNLWKNESDPI
jgi:gas vesicle protein